MSQTSKTLWDHLDELKNVIIKTLIVWLVATCGAFVFSNQLVEIITKPVTDRGLVLQFLAPTDSFFYVFKICSLAGLVVSLPVALVFIWQYISPALLSHEKAFISRYIFSIFFFTTLGVLFGYFFLIPSTFNFLLDFTPKNTELNLTANDYMSFLFGLLILMVLVFQIPIVVFGLIRSGLVDKSFFTSHRKEIYFAIVVLIATFGASDILTWALSTLPIIALFEGAVLFASKKQIKN